MKKLLKVVVLGGALCLATLVLTGVGIYAAIISRPNFYAAAVERTNDQRHVEELAAEFERAMTSAEASYQARTMFTSIGIPTADEARPIELRINPDQLNAWLAVQEQSRGRQTTDVSRLRVCVSGGDIRAGVTADLDGFKTILAMKLTPEPKVGDEKPFRISGLSVGSLVIPPIAVNLLPTELLNELNIRADRGAPRLIVDTAELDHRPRSLIDIAVDGNTIVLQFQADRPTAVIARD